MLCPGASSLPPVTIHHGFQRLPDQHQSLLPHCLLLLLLTRFRRRTVRKYCATADTAAL